MKPESYGFTEDYEVIESQPIYEMTYNDEMQYNLKPKHRYCLRERFRFILNQLCGHSGVIPDKILDKLRINHTKRKRHNAYSRFVLKVMTRKNIAENNETKYEDALNLNNIPREEIWEYMHEILKKHKLAKYYNRIPAILGMAGYDRGTCTVPKDAYELILYDFDRLAKVFNEIKDDVGRKYFPSLRYVALKLMDRHSVKTDWPITGMRTMHKKNALDKIYALMWETINKKEDAELEAFFSFLDQGPQ